MKRKKFLIIGITLVVVFSFLVWHSLKSKDDRHLAGKIEIRLQLQWFDQSQFAGFYVAKEQGYYDKEGLDVEIIPGGFKTNPIQVILMKEAEIALVTGNKLLQARESKYDLKAFGTVFNKSIACFMSKTEKNIKTPYDFVGKKVAVYRGFDTEHILLCLLKKLKINRNNVTIVDGGDITPFVKGDVDVWPSYIINEPIRMEEEGISVKILDPDYFGVQFYSDTLFSTTEYWMKNKNTLKKFIRASAKGWEYAESHKDKAIDIMFRTRRNLAAKSSSSQQRKMLDICCAYLRGGAKNLLFYMNPDRWKAMENDLYEANIIQNKGYIQDLCDFKLIEEALLSD
jgi:ABC-type nitrate/sulfonate/bicarbonate transport system substrate-binding protein